jgi:hypothetical protein
MSFRYDGRGVGVDPERQLRMDDAFTRSIDHYPSLALTDLVTGQTWGFHIKLEHIVLPPANEGGRPETAPAAFRLDRSRIEEIAARIAETRRWRGPALTIEDVLEAVREGAFIYGTKGGHDPRNPDFEVTYVDIQKIVRPEP